MIERAERLIEPVPLLDDRINQHEDGCWIWTGAKSRGYGFLKVNGKRQLAHRVVYERYRGTIPAGLELDHLCRVPACVNPDHLEPVTHLTNMRRGLQGMKTHCPRGHEYTPDNIYWKQRHTCRICRRCTLDRLKATRRFLPNREKTHCPAGHPYNLENTYRDKLNRRECRVCHREQERQRAQRLRMERQATQ